MGSAEPPLGSRARIGVAMSCAALAHIRSSEFPETVRIYDEGHTPRTIAEADRAALGLKWRERLAFAEKSASAAFLNLYRRPPTEEELSDARSRWVRTLISYSDPLRRALRMNCAELFELADATHERARAGYGAEVTAGER